MNKSKNTDTPVSRERSGFTGRLSDAFIAAGYPDIGATGAARMFNERSPVNVTTHAVRKWLRGDCIPSQPHIQTLACWLLCDPGWLRYGQPGDPVQFDPSADLQDAVLVNELASLDADTRALVYDFVALLLKNRKAR
ncbi:hypothetical protein [Massilia sp. DWR3-1-1]|uniref:hypothetical protein n=1 Tax=Massilia sp. DWR3-1-1 TaxID=2804559 RepID=UPI003CEE5EF7